MSELAVVHLVRRANGEEPLLRFLRSYRDHPAGVEHDLVLLMKGFDSEAEAAHYRDLAAGVSSRSIQVPDVGYDVTAYLAAAWRLPHGRLCFVNSFSLVLVDRWLELLVDALDRPGAGIVGATGSWGSQFSHMQFYLRLGGAYASIYDDRATAQRHMRALAHGTDGRPAKRTPGRMLNAGNEILRRAVGFSRFPAAHVRTNGFMLDSAVLRNVKAGRQRDKLDAYRLEGGRQSITCQVRAMGLSAMIAGVDGRVYEVHEWPSSGVFWQHDQANLILADNQTAVYDAADLPLRTTLSRFAWGTAAEPTAPPPMDGT